MQREAVTWTQLGAGRSERASAATGEQHAFLTEILNGA
jgi:hypothetical protein